MIGHYLAKIYGSILERELSVWAERHGHRARGQAGFRRGFSTLDHILTLRALIEERRAQGDRRRLYCCFVDFRKAFDSVPRFRLMQRLQDIGVPEAIRWGIYPLYESVTGRVRAPGGFSDGIESTIGVKQHGCLLSPTLFGIYIDELSEYVDTYGDAGSSLAGVMIPLLLYADDVVLISDSPEGLQRQLDALQRFCADRDLTVNLGKTKVMVFNTTQAWVTRAEHQFTFRGEMVEQVRSYVYLGVTFTGPRFSLKQAADARLDRGFAALGRLERQCAHVQFQEPRTKLWLFESLVTPALLDWIKRHRRSLIITVSIFGAGYMCYQKVKAFQKKGLIEKDEYEARAFIMHQERIEAQLQVHFQSIQRISDSTTLPSILLRLKSQIFSLLDLSRLTEELEQEKDNSRLSAQERTELWENIKTLSFSRATCCMWALTIAVLFVRVQFNILARHVYLATARDISNVEQLDQRKDLSKSCQQKYILQSEFLAEKFLEIVKKDVEAVVIKTLGSKSLRDLCNLRDLRDIFSNFCLNLEHRLVEWLAYLALKDSVPEVHHDATLKVEADTALHDETGTLEQLLNETRDILRSQEFKEVLAASFETVLDRMMEEFNAVFEGGHEGRVPLAKLLSPVSGIGVLLLEHPDENRFLQSIANLQEVQSFSASVYSASPTIARG
ncbi:hypothetical protein L7F22_050828 [Adiantum nelumboides]|nr:hypothetical protein [Adiantum nelumboides]